MQKEDPMEEVRRLHIVDVLADERQLIASKALRELTSSDSIKDYLSAIEDIQAFDKLVEKYYGWTWDGKGTYLR